MRAQRLDAAEARAAAAVQHFPSSKTLLDLHATLAQRRQDWPAAAERLRRLAAVEQPQPGEATLTRLASALRQAGRLDESRATVQDALRRHPDSALLRAELTLLDLRDPVVVDDPAALDQPTPRRHPYQNLRPAAFWNRTVENVHPLGITDWYRRKFDITGLPVATAGSCFAQHIGRHLRKNGYATVDVEPPPSFLKPARHLDFGYGMYSARYGNVYTPRQLLQLLQRAVGEFTPVDDAWARGSGWVDPFRPTIEPEPFESIEELHAARAHHLRAVTQLFRQAGVFVFTLGLTEAWESTVDGAIFPVAPGVSGGLWDPQRYRLHNFNHAEVIDDLERFFALARRLNPTLRFLLTVSPVPLMATASRENVVVATSYSKSVLRAAAGQLAAAHEHVDYFPSFEIIGAPAMRSLFYNADLRSVSEHGVEHVMRQFFAQHRPSAATPAMPKAADGAEEDDVACDEELLREFGIRST